jgi:hypothetical protein
MGETTSPMMIRDMPIDVRMRLKAIAAMQHRRLRDVAIEALREKAERHRGEWTSALSWPDEVGSSR